jgi:hypothetical protein
MTFLVTYSISMLLFSERVTRFERATSTLARLRSTTELYPRPQHNLSISDLSRFVNPYWKFFFEKSEVVEAKHSDRSIGEKSRIDHPNASPVQEAGVKSQEVNISPHLPKLSFKLLLTVPIFGLMLVKTERYWHKVLLGWNVVDASNWPFLWHSWHNPSHDYF